MQKEEPQILPLSHLDLGGGYELSEQLAKKHRLKLADLLLWVYLEFQEMCSIQESIPSVIHM